MLIKKEAYSIHFIEEINDSYFVFEMEIKDIFMVALWN